jgi:hypothetical protein
VYAWWTRHRVPYLAALFFSAAVYACIYGYVWRFVSYPIELEWREGSIWLHALAQSYGVNIFAADTIAYVNANHGIFDHIIKGALVWAFRFLEPQYLLRCFVVLFPAISLAALFAQSRRNLPLFPALVGSLALCCAMLIAVHDIGHWNTCIGRSDSTAFTLLAIAYLCSAASGAARPARLLQHISSLAIALVFSTNWKIYPVALTIPIILAQRHDALRIRELIRSYLLILAYTVGTCGLFIAIWFHADATLYYRYFFGFFSAKSPLPPATAPFATMIYYVRTPAIVFLLLLSVAPVCFELWRHLGKRAGTWPRTLAAIAILMSLLVSIAAFKMNFMAAGYWYLCPQVIVVAAYYNARYTIGPGLASVILIFSLGILSRSDNLPLMRWYYRLLGETLPAARIYTDELVRLDQAFGVYSEEAFLFKRSRALPPIDMGDVAEAFAKAGYNGPRFNAIFAKQQSQIVSHAHALVFIGPCASSALKQLADDPDYSLLLKSPTLAIGGNVYVRQDRREEVQRFLANHAAPSR